MEQQRVVRRKQQIAEKIQIVTRDDDNQKIVKSAYTVPEEVIANNNDALQKLFGPRTKTFCYRDAETLMHYINK